MPRMFRQLLSGDNGGWFAALLADLATIGYDAEWFCGYRLAALGAPHVRNRVFILAYPSSGRSNQFREKTQQTIKDQLAMLTLLGIKSL